VFSKIQSFLRKAEKAMAALPASRVVLLEQIADYILKSNANQVESNIVFICTHNSRRSHLAHILLHSAVHYHKIPIKFGIFSGGTETTAFNWRAAEALKSFGFEYTVTEGENPTYRISIDEKNELEVFSKVYNDPNNPSSNFAAIMTCSEADQACPMVIGAEKRIALTYEDPKDADGTAEEKEVYARRTFQIATEMVYLTNYLNSRIQRN
jgi:arsenate reductase